MAQLPIPWGKPPPRSTPSRQTSPNRSAGTSTGGFSLDDLIASHTHAPPFDAPRTHSSASSSPSRAPTPSVNNSPPARSPPTATSPTMSPHPRSPLLRSHTEPLVQLVAPHQGIKRSTTHASDLTSAGPGGRKESERKFSEKERGRARARSGAGTGSSQDSDRLVLEKYALYETKTVRSFPVSPAGLMLIRPGIHLEILHRRLEPGRHAVSRPQAGPHRRRAGRPGARPYWARSDRGLGRLLERGAQGPSRGSRRGKHGRDSDGRQGVLRHRGCETVPPPPATRGTR